MADLEIDRGSANSEKPKNVQQKFCSHLVSKVFCVTLVVLSLVLSCCLLEDTKRPTPISSAACPPSNNCSVPPNDTIWTSLARDALNVTVKWVEGGQHYAERYFPVAVDMVLDTCSVFQTYVDGQIGGLILKVCF